MQVRSAIRVMDIKCISAVNECINEIPPARRKEGKQSMCWVGGALHDGGCSVLGSDVDG